MPDATGTPTSPDNIPTYSTSADPPSGKGFNTAMAAIQTALTARIKNALMSAVGDLIYASGVSTPARLAIGTVGSVLQSTGSAPSWSGLGVYRKNTDKVVVNTVAETDLLNGEITIAANAMGANGAIRLTVTGDLINNSGSAQNTPRFKLKLGGTTLIDTNVVGVVMSSGANRLGWRCDVIIRNRGATNSQETSFVFKGTIGNGVSAALTGFTSGNGLMYSNLISGGFGTLEGVADNFNAVDTTAARLLELTVTNPVANANFDVSLRGATVEII